MAEIREFIPIFPGHRLAGCLNRAVALQHGQLFLWSPVALAFGIAAHFALPWQSQRSGLLAALLACALASALLRRVPGHLVIAAGCSLAALGLVLAGWREQAVAAPRLTRDMTVVLEAVVLDVTSKHVLVRPVAASRSLPNIRRIRLKLPTVPPAFEPGQQVTLRARLAVVPTGVSPDGYDFARLAWFQGIGATGRLLGTPTIVRTAPTGTVTGWFDRTRERAARRFQEQIPGEAGAVAGALIVGERNSLSDETTQAMRVSGLQHLLSVSGFHLVMLAGALFMGTRYLLALWPWLALHAPTKSIAAVVAMLGSLAYTLLTGSAYPTLRSLAAITIVMLGILAGRTAISLRLLAAVGILLLLYRPEALLDVSFQLSFTGVAALVAFFDSARVRHWLGPQEHEGWVMRLLRFTGSTLLATLVAELALAPIAIAHFNQIGIYGLLANMIGVPVTEFILMPAGFLSLLLQPLGLDGLVNPVFGFALEKFIAFARWITHLPHAQMLVPEIGGGAFALIMFGFVVLILVRGRLKWASMIFVSAGLIMAAFLPAPDVRIAPDGKTVAVRTIKGNLLFPDLRAGKFARARWLEDEATPADDATSWNGTREGAGVADCTSGVCRVRLGSTGRTLGLLSRTATPRTCADADIMIDLRAIRQIRCTAAVYIDRRWLWDHGATDLYFGKNSVTLRTYADAVGDHAWKQ
jgi:competence protein ComEC